MLVGNRLFTRNLTPGLGERSELYEYDQRHRLRRMDRGEISGDPEPVLVSPIADNDLAAAQDWTILDRRGNWNEFTETIGVSPVTITQTRSPNGVNEYQAIDPDGPGPQSPVNLAHDANGNVTLDPTARNLGDGEGGVTVRAVRSTNTTRKTGLRPYGGRTTMRFCCRSHMTPSAGGSPASTTRARATPAAAAAPAPA